MRWTREEYIAHMTFQDVGREMFTELFGPLIGLDEEWRRQGAREDEIDLSAFGWDYVPNAWAACRTGAVTGLTPRVLSENAHETISINEMGTRVKLCKGSATIPLPMEYAVRGWEDWERVKKWYTFNEERIDRDALLALKKKQEEGTLILCAMPGGFDEPRTLMGEEALCIAYFEEPELIRDMLETFGDTCLRVFERVCDILVPDVLHVHEDMAGKTGPLIGPNQVRDFIAPYYRKVWEPLRESGCALFSQDSDGDIRPVIDAFLETGLNCLYPAEPHAGMDINALREKYGTRAAFKGGIDKFALRGTKADIDRELSAKLTGAARGGGTVFALDHRIPGGVSIENYRYYVKRGRELLGLPAAEPSPFVRMAF